MKSNWQTSYSNRFKVSMAKHPLIYLVSSVDFLFGRISFIALLLAVFILAICTQTEILREIKNPNAISKERIDIQNLILSKAKMFYESKRSKDWEIFISDTQKMVSEFSDLELGILCQLATNSNLAIEQRVLAIYFLNAYGLGSGPYLRKIFLSPIAGEKTNHEYSLRTMALEGLESHRNYSYVPSKDEVKDVYLQKMLAIAKLGQITHKPLLHQFLEKIRSNQPGELVSEK